MPLNLLSQVKAVLNPLPNTAQELVWILKQMKQEDPNYHFYLSLAEGFVERFAGNVIVTKEQIDGLANLVLLQNKDITLAVVNTLVDRITVSLF